MKRHRHTPEQVVRKLREGERLLNQGKDLTEVSRHLEISEATWNPLRNQYGGMKAPEEKRLRELEIENGRTGGGRYPKRELIGPVVRFRPQIRSPLRQPAGTARATRPQGGWSR
jgi:hypothetical protein